MEKLENFKLKVLIKLFLHLKKQKFLIRQNILRMSLRKVLFHLKKFYL